VISTVLAALSTWVGAASPESAIGHAVNFAVSFATISILFAMLFKWFPDTDVAWSDVWPGALAAALLFNLGKGLIAWYIGSQAFESTYGAAASIVVLLIWVYYTAQIVLFGAELSHAYAAVRGSRRFACANATSEHTSAAARRASRSARKPSCPRAAAVCSRDASPHREPHDDLYGMWDSSGGPVPWAPLQATAVLVVLSACERGWSQREPAWRRGGCATEFLASATRARS
jgi:hypothetical protein